ncbi:hypothetical protein V1478_005063 [Vespula squamosa]|uniref:Uncharacterized protein n=1 Tax=Vespula squamosa TaxID=30214 RepID=A0ABD2BDB3_VESSQ
MSGTIKGWVRSAAYKPDILNLDLAATSSSNSRRWTVKNEHDTRIILTYKDIHSLSASNFEYRCDEVSGDDMLINVKQLRQCFDVYSPKIKRRTDPVTIQINQRFVSVVIRRRQRFEIQN